MTTIYTGSNYGIISTLNSGSGSIPTSTTTAKSWELVKNYTSGSVLIDLTSAAAGGWIDFQIEYSNDNLGTVTATETHRFLQSTDTTAITPLYPPSPTTLEFKPQGAFMRIVLNNLSPITVAYTIQTRFNNSADPDTLDGAISSANSFNETSVGTSVTINGAFEDISEYSLITVLTVGTAATIPEACTIQCIFSTDGTNNDRVVQYSVQDITANGLATNSLTFNPAHTLLPIARYFKLVFINNTTTILNTLHITTTYHINKSKGLTSRVTQALTDQFDSDTTRSILTGRTIGTLLPEGHYQNIGVQNQAIATYIREPATAFGEILTGQLTPQIQYDYSNGEPYEVQAPIYRNIPADTTYTYTNAFLQLTSISTAATNTVIQAYSSEYTKYKPGLGIDARMTTVFNTHLGAGTNQYVGLFTPENSLTFGYFDTNGFCIRYGRGGIQQVIDINITGGTSNGSQIEVDFGGTVVTTIGLSLTNSIVQGANALATAINAATSLNVYGWKASYYKATTAATTYTVRAIRNYSSTTNITVNITIVGGYTITPNSSVRSGQDTSYVYIPQTQWNVDTCLGLTTGTLQTRYNTNPSGFELIPTNGNVYRIVFQYLGFGAITFYVENPQTGTFMAVHQIKYSNANIVPSVTSPNYKIGFGIENTTNTLLTLKGASFASFVQGNTIPAPLYRSYANIIPTNTGGTLSITKQNSRILFGFRILETKISLNSNLSSTITINRSNLFLNSFSAALNVTAPNNANPQPSANIVFQLVKNPTAFYLGDPPTTLYQPDWTVYERDSTILAFNGTARTSTTTGIGYTGGVNVIDFPLVENAANTISLESLLINVSADDIYLVTYYGNTNSTVTSFDVMASISYQINA
jgi:hypothetical protein